MEYSIKQERGVWVLTVLEGANTGMKFRYSTKRALLAAVDGLSARLAD